MPLYEYSCHHCGHKFETLVRGSEKPQCPTCQSDELEKMFSLFSVNNPGGGKKGSSFDLGSSCSTGASGVPT